MIMSFKAIVECPTAMSSQVMVDGLQQAHCTSRDDSNGDNNDADDDDDDDDAGDEECGASAFVMMSSVESGGGNNIPDSGEYLFINISDQIACECERESERLWIKHQNFSW